MKKLAAALLPLMFLPATAGLAAPGPATLSGPAQVAPGGRMVVVTASLDRSQVPGTVITTQYNWAVLVDGTPSEDFLVWPDGTKVIFNSPDLTPATNGRVVDVILNVQCLTGTAQTVKGAGGVDQPVVVNAKVASLPLAVLKVQVGDPPVPPPPDPNTPPNPGPAPDPVLPQGQFGAAPMIFNAFKANTLLQGPEKSKLAAVLAVTYEGQATKIKTDASYNQIQKILLDTHTLNAGAFATAGIDATKASDVKAAIGDKIYAALNTDKTARTAADLGTLFSELATGLRAAQATFK